MQCPELILCLYVPDDELSTATGYHNALPLEVHGSGYTQMQMISNAKAEKLVMTSLLYSTFLKILRWMIIIYIHCPFPPLN